jgi:ribosomal protein L31
MSLINTPTIDPHLQEQQFTREHAIGDNRFKKFPPNCMVLGLGGIGSHVADILGSISAVKNIVLFDNDIIELSNLARTIYQYRHIGEYKVEAVAEIISSRNLLPNIYPINMLFNEDTCKKINEDENLDFLKLSNFMVFDCRDNYYGDYDLLNTIFNQVDTHTVIRAAYNEMSLTIDINPKEHPVWGRGGYNQNTASHSVPSRLAAILIILCASNYEFLKSTPLFNIPLTFGVDQLIDFIFKGITIDKMDEKERTKIVKLLENNITKEVKPK